MKNKSRKVDEKYRSVQSLSISAFVPVLIAHTEGQAKCAFPLLSQTCVNGAYNEWIKSNKTFLSGRHVFLQARVTAIKLPHSAVGLLFHSRYKNGCVGLFSV